MYMYLYSMTFAKRPKVLLLCDCKSNEERKINNNHNNNKEKLIDKQIARDFHYSSLRDVITYLLNA